MYVSPLKEIYLSDNAKITINVLKQVYINNYILTKYGGKIDLEKFEKLVKEDEELRILIIKFVTADKENDTLSEKEYEIRNKIKEEISKMKVKSLAQFHYDYDCEGVIEIRTPQKFIYKGKNFTLETIEKCYNLSCYVAHVNTWLSNVDPDLRIKVIHDENGIVIIKDNYYIIISNEISLAQVLGYFGWLNGKGKMIDFLYNIMLIDWIERQKMVPFKLFREIQKRIKKLLKQAKT